MFTIKPTRLVGFSDGASFSWQSLSYGAFEMGRNGSCRIISCENGMRRELKTLIMFILDVELVLKASYG